MDVYTLLYFKWITSRDLLYSTGSSAQGYVAVWIGGGGWGRKDTCICMAEFLHCSTGNYYNIVNQVYLGCPDGSAG